MSSVTVYKIIFLCPYHYVRILLITDTGGLVADEPTSLDIGGRIDEPGGVVLGIRMDRVKMKQFKFYVTKNNFMQGY